MILIKPKIYLRVLRLMSLNIRRFRTQQVATPSNIFINVINSLLTKKCTDIHRASELLPKQKR